MPLEPVAQFTVWVIPVLFAITVHEAAHAFMANYYGDNTAKMLGRLTLNPIKHIDILGTIVIPIAMVLTVGFVFGWAKPVPIDWRKLKNAKKNMIPIAFAGPFSNLLMGIFWALVLRLAVMLGTDSTAVWFVIYTASAGIFINTILFVLNLLPIPPLDGSRIVAGLLPARMAITYSKFEPYGFFIIIGLFFIGVLGQVLNPVISFVLQLSTFLSGLNPGEINGLLTIITQ